MAGATDPAKEWNPLGLRLMNAWLALPSPVQIAIGVVISLAFGVAMHDPMLAVLPLLAGLASHLYVRRHGRAPMPAPVTVDGGRATVTFVVSRLDSTSFDRSLRHRAAAAGLRYSSVLGPGLLLRDLRAQVDGDRDRARAFAEDVRLWTRVSDLR